MPLSYDNLLDDANPSVLQGKRVTISQNVDAFSKTWPDNAAPVFHWGDKDNPPEYEREIIWEMEQKDFTVASKKKSTKKKTAKKTSGSKPTVKKILKKIEKTAPRPPTFNHLYGQ